MNNMQLRIFLLVLAAFISAVMGAQGQAAEEQIRSSGQVKFVSGGVGEDSDARMQSLGKDFNLRLLFAAKDGHYLADIAVTITDASGAKVLDAVSEGPWLLAKLVPGAYQITATYAEKSFTRATTIASSGRREIFFRWDEPQESQ
jgi:hypothetical protein